MILPTHILHQTGTSDEIDLSNIQSSLKAIRKYFSEHETEQLNESIALKLLSHGLPIGDLCSLCDVFSWSAYRFIVDLGDEWILLDYIHKPNRALLKILKEPESILKYHQMTNDMDVADSMARLTDRPDILEAMMDIKPSQKMTNGF